MRRTTSTTIAGLATLTLTLGLAGTANAETFRTDDPDDSPHGSDIVELQVRHSTEDLFVRIYHDDLRADPASGSSGTLFIDTDESDAGPEYVFVAGYYEGTDYRLLHADGWAARNWGEPVENGDYIMRVRYATERVLVRISRPALGNPDAVRVAVRSAGGRRVDWVGQPRSFTPWLTAG